MIVSKKNKTTITEAADDKVLGAEGVVKQQDFSDLDSRLQQLADDIDAAVVIDGEASKGVIEKTLDNLLVKNKRMQGKSNPHYLNALFVGVAGTGKTSRIKSWADKNGVNLFVVRCAGMDAGDLGGAIRPSDDGQTVKRLGTEEFDKLERPDSVLFLDELNRAPDSVRTDLLELVNSHEIPDPREPSGQRHLDNYLFTIAAINPDIAGYTVNPVDKAMKTRFGWYDVPLEKKEYLKYLLDRYSTYYKEAKTRGEKLEILNTIGIAKTLLQAPDSELAFDTEKDEEQYESDPHWNGLTLNSRTFEALLDVCDGSKKKFLQEWDHWSNNLKKKAAERVLANYKEIDDKATQALNNPVEDPKVGEKKSVFRTEKTNSEKVNDLLGI